MKTSLHLPFRLLATLAALTLLAASALAETTYPAWAVTHDPLVAADYSAKACAVDQAGNVYVAGSSTAGAKKLFYLAKHDGFSGQRLWFREYGGGGAENVANSVSVSRNNSGSVFFVVATGFTTTAAGNKDFFTACVSSENQLLWSNT